MNELLDQISELGVVPVVAIDRVEHAAALAEALLKGGLPCAEITFRTRAAADSIRTIANKYPELLLGAGTVLSQDQAEQAVDAGACFIVSPGYNAKVVNWCLQNNIVVTPGVATPTEINMALEAGLSILKFFPAQALGGTKMLKAVSAPYGDVKFIPTGGITAGNLADYLKLPMVIACGGSWLVKRALIAEGQFELITSYVKDAMHIIKQVREGSMYHGQ